MKLETTANEEGFLYIADQLQPYFEKIKDKPISIEIKEIRNIRSHAQNRAMHKWFTMIADEINNQGHTIEYRSGNFHFERKFKMEDIKEIFRIIMKPITGKTSTAKITKQELNECQEPFMKCIAENWQISIPFPSEEELRILSSIN